MPRDWNGALGIFLKALRIDRLRGWFCRHVAMNGFPDFCRELPGLMYLHYEEELGHHPVETYAILGAISL
ncbi:MAG: hypothetical protein F6K39_42860, partial [Okeania sp. SIO3B3]|nr:hypothetical protein [Okeania sp. SIO3B3]